MTDIIKRKDLDDFVVDVYSKKIEDNIKYAKLQGGNWTIVRDNQFCGLKIIENAFNNKKSCEIFKKIVDKLLESGYDCCFGYYKYTSYRTDFPYFGMKEYKQIGLKIKWSRICDTGEWIVE